MAEQDRLAALEVGVARHQDGAVELDPAQQGAEQLGEGRVEQGQPAAQPEPHVGRHLVVARAGGVQLLADLANQLGEPRLDRHVHVLMGVGRHEAAGTDLRPHQLEPFAQPLGLFEGEDADLSEHGHMGQRAIDVLVEHAQVHRQGRRKPRHLLGRRPAEPPAHQTRPLLVAAAAPVARAVTHRVASGASIPERSGIAAWLTASVLPASAGIPCD